MTLRYKIFRIPVMPEEFGDKARRLKSKLEITRDYSWDCVDPLSDDCFLGVGNITIKIEGCKRSYTETSTIRFGMDGAQGNEEWRKVHKFLDSLDKRVKELYELTSRDVKINY